MNNRFTIKSPTPLQEVEGSIPSPPMHLPGLLTFEAVARHLNFARAAAELSVTPTAVSRTIKSVEAQLNVRLLNRTTRSVSLTEAGNSLYTALAPALAQIKDSLSQALLATDQPSGTVRLNSSYVAYRIFIEPHLTASNRLHGKIPTDQCRDITG